MSKKQIVLFVLALVFTGLTIPGAFVKNPLLVFIIIGYLALLLWGGGMIYTDYVKSERSEQGKVFWYKQPFCLCGIMAYVLVLIWIIQRLPGGFMR